MGDFRENCYKIAKIRPNSIWSTNSNPVDFAFSKNDQLFEIWAFLGHKTPKYNHRAGRLQPLSFNVLTAVRAKINRSTIYFEYTSVYFYISFPFCTSFTDFFIFVLYSVILDTIVKIAAHNTKKKQP